MRITKSVVTAVLATASVGLAAGTATAAPAQPEAVSAPQTSGGPGSTAPRVMQWASQGMNYAARPAPGGGVQTTIDAGTFTLTRGGSEITVSDGHGNVIASAPTTVSVSGRPVSFAAAGVVTGFNIGGSIHQ